MMTMWECCGDDGIWRFNHSEPGVSTADAPVPSSPAQNWWRNKTWRKRIVGGPS